MEGNRLRRRPFMLDSGLRWNDICGTGGVWLLVSSARVCLDQAWAGQ